MSPLFRGALLALLVFTSVARAADPARPNILFLFADDWGRHAGVYAAVDGRPSVNDVIKTPNIDAVAKRGVIFRNAFVGSPSCTPCRSALLSGRYFYRTNLGAILEGAKWDFSIPAWPLLMRESGYHIGKSYKVWSPGTPPDAPYGQQAYAYEKAGRDFNYYSAVATQEVTGGLSVAEAKEKLLGQVRQNFDTFLKAKRVDQPFCYWFGPTLTHRPWTKGSGKALWGIDPESLKGKMPASLPDVPEVREDFADYMGEAQAWDASVGVILKQLEEAGQLANTLIFISGDHGMGGMPHCKCNLYDTGTGVALIAAGPGVPGGRVLDDFVWLPDLAATFLEAGGVKQPEGMDARSILPILRSTQSGQVDPTRTWVFTGRERHVASAREGNLPYPHRALRNADYLYIRNFAPDRWPMGDPKAVTETSEPSPEQLEQNTFVAFADMDASPTKAWLVAHRHDPQWERYYLSAFAKRPAEELYDLKRDPAQMQNIAYNPKAAGARAAMAKQMEHIMERTGDRRLQGDFDRPPFTDPMPERPQRRAELEEWKGLRISAFFHPVPTEQD